MKDAPNYRLPVKREVLPPAPVWRQAAPLVIRGAALVAAGVIGEWVLRSATKKAVSLPFSPRKPKSKAVAKAAPVTVAVTETIVYQRTVVRR